MKKSHVPASAPHVPTARRSASKADQDRLFFAPFGARLQTLPWATSRVARLALPTPLRRRLGLAELELAQGWLDNPAESLRRALAHVCRGVMIVHSGARERLPRWVMHDYRGRLSSDPAEIVDERSRGIGRLRRYAITGRDPYADRPVNVTTLFESADHAQPLLELLSGLGIENQLRVVLYDAQLSLLGYVGLYLPASEAHTLDEHAALHALIPALRQWLITARAIGMHPLDDTGLITALDVNEQPCFLVRDDGNIVFANRAARSRGIDASTLAQVRASAGHGVRLSLSTVTLSLVTHRSGQPAVDSRIEALPSFLRPVARGLMRGLADKEIAQELQLSHSTVRTYTQRVMSRLAVSSRRELMSNSLSLTKSIRE
jgi:PAS domain-containing protein